MSDDDLLATMTTMRDGRTVHDGVAFYLSPDLFRQYWDLATKMVSMEQEPERFPGVRRAEHRLRFTDIPVRCSESGEERVSLVECILP